MSDHRSFVEKIIQKISFIGAKRSDSKNDQLIQPLPETLDFYINVKNKFQFQHTIGKSIFYDRKWSLTVFCHFSFDINK
jgi:hypothetical protein